MTAGYQCELREVADMLGVPLATVMMLAMEKSGELTAYVPEREKRRERRRKGRPYVPATHEGAADCDLSWVVDV